MSHVIFLSYSRANLTLAQQLESELGSDDLTVWRDQEQLTVGARWPKALGEAIQKTDALLLLWSAHAAQSKAVEHEWTTALALNKPILPCVVDETPLPPALAACNAISLTANVAQMAARIRAALALDSRPAVASNHAKPAWERWRVWVTVVGVLAAVGMAVALWQNYTPAKISTAAATQERQQLFAGSVSDDKTKEPLPGVKVFLLLDEKLLGSEVTDGLGRYRFRVAAGSEAEVTLLAQKDGFQTQKRYAQLGNANFNFQMKRGGR